MQINNSCQCPKLSYPSRRQEKASDTLDERACRTTEQWNSEEPRHEERKGGPSLAGEGEVLDRIQAECIVTVMSDLQQKWACDG